MNVNLKLIILHIELETMSNGCLLDGEPPSIISYTLKNEDENLSNRLRQLLVEYLEIRPEWVKFNLVDVIQEERDLAIIYSCLIPSILKNLKGKWIPLGEINDKDTKKLVFKATQHQGY